VQVSAGTSPELDIRVYDPAGAPVTAFDDLHTQKMHVVAISSDLKDFQHVHPTLEADGSLRVDVPVNAAQPYDVFFEYDPAGPAGEQTNRTKLVPEGAQEVAPRLASGPYYGGSRAFTSTAGDTKIELAPVAHGMLMPNMGVKLQITVKTATGAPATDLVDWLGMPGHAIVVSEDRKTFIHAHAMPPGMDMGDMDGMGGMDMGGMDMGHSGHPHHPSTSGSTTAPNVLEIPLTLPSAGYFKMFVQVKRGDNVVTVPFVLRSMAM
jgi:hypothetical protein